MRGKYDYQFFIIFCYLIEIYFFWASGKYFALQKPIVWEFNLAMGVIMSLITGALIVKKAKLDVKGGN